jgi:two-component system phosphate regulon sensor histidine kinase PhoR
MKIRLIFSYIIVISASFAFLAFFLDKNLEEKSLHNIQNSIITQARLIEAQIPAESLRKKDSRHIETLIRSMSQKAGCRITVIDINGIVLVDSEKSLEDIPKMENHFYRPEIKSALSDDIGIDTRYSPTLKIEMLYVALPIKDKNEVLGILRLALPLVSVQKMLFEVRKTIFLGLLFGLGLAFLFGSAIAAGTVKPVIRMINVSRMFSKGDFSHRIIKGSKDEIGELADTLNKMAQDIEHKIRQIETQNQKLAAVLNSMVEGVVVVDKESRIVSVNPTIEKIFGIMKKDAEGKVFLEAIRNNDISEVIDSVLRKKKAASAELTLIYPVSKIFEVNATPIFDNGDVAGCLAVIHDITEIRKLETVRSDFIANVSHEFKTPLTSIKGFIETLLDGAMDDRENSREFLKIIREHADRLNGLVDDLLSLSHLESGEIDIEKKDVNLRERAEAVILSFKSQIGKKKIEIRNELPAGLLIRADKNRIVQVLTNLIDNAIKFNKDRGLVKIWSQEANGKIKVIVEDSGIGIPEKDIPRIFERFYRVDKARSRELGGTGLGLSIVKHIVERHDGDVGVESIEGAGSKFYFSIPS